MTDGSNPDMGWAAGFDTCRACVAIDQAVETQAHRENGTPPGRLWTAIPKPRQV